MLNYSLVRHIDSKLQHRLQKDICIIAKWTFEVVHTSRGSQLLLKNNTTTRQFNHCQAIKLVFIEQHAMFVF